MPWRDVACPYFGHWNIQYLLWNFRLTFDKPSGIHWCWYPIDAIYENRRRVLTKLFDGFIFVPVGDKRYIWIIVRSLCYGGSYNGTWQLFGHVHTSRNNTGKDAPRLSMLLPTQYDVGVDNNDFTPVSFAQVKAIIEKQIEQVKKGEQ